MRARELWLRRKRALNVKELDSKYIAGTYARFPIVIKSGKGSVAVGEDGREYIDLSTGIAVNTFGYSDSEWVSAVTKQLNTLQHTSNLYYSSPDAALAEQLCLRTGMKKVFFSNSGAEANECAIKAARKYSAEKKGAEYFEIVTLENSFHGRTLTTLAATGQDVFHKDFRPLTPGFCHTPANGIAALENTVKAHKTAAIMLECVQGEGGVLPLEREFVLAAADIAKKQDIPLIIDEVQTGNGRTGELFAYMNYGIAPDIVTTAKGLGGGLPIGATLLGEKVEGIFTPGSNGSTFGGNPVCCAGALNILSRIDGALLSEVRDKSKYIIGELTGASGIKSVTGMGLMLGIETEKSADEIVKECMENGVLVIKAKSKIRLLPALNIPFGLLEKAIKVLKKACEVC